MLKAIKQINKIGLIVSILTFVSAIIFYEFSEISLILISQLLISSIGLIAILTALNSISKGHFKYKTEVIIYGYFSTLIFVFSIFNADFFTNTWNFQLASILFLLFVALDDKLDHTSFYNYKLFKYLFRISALIIFVLTLFKVNSSLILSLGVFLLMILSFVSLGSIFLPKKQKEEN